MAGPVLPAAAEGQTLLAPSAGADYAAPEVPVQMMALGLIVLGAHLGGKLCRRLRLSEVTGQLLGGALVGPYALHLVGILSGTRGGIYDDALHAFHFFIFVFLSMVAFGIGEELHISRLRQVGWTSAIICLIQGGLTWICISAGFYAVTRLGVFGHPIPLVEAMLIGSIGIATAPAVTFVLMNQLRIEGRLRHVLGSIVVLDDLIEVIVFSLLMQISLRQQEGHAVRGADVILVAREVLLAAAIGGAIYLVLRLLVRRHAGSLHADHEQEHAYRDEAFLRRILAEHPSPSAEILLLVMGTVSLGAGFAYFQHWPFLITAAFAGLMVANLHSHAIFDSLKIENITPVFNLGFFALIGANISLKELQGETAWLSGLYVLLRLLGKIGGTWLGCRLLGEERKITACLPHLMLPQAGVAAVEAVYVSAVLKKPEIAAIILPAIVFFEVVGVFLVDRGLKRWRSWVAGEEEELRRRRAVVGPAEAARRLLTYLTPTAITLDLEGGDKRSVIEELIDRARQVSQQHIDRAQALQVLGERERLAPTGFGNGIAIPHCRLMGLDTPVMVFGRHRSNVEYGGVDNSRCDLFLLMLSSARDPAEHLQLLSAAAHILGDDTTRQQLRTADTPEAVIDVLRAIGKSDVGD